MRLFAVDDDSPHFWSLHSWVLTGSCCPEQNAGLAACPGATSSDQEDLQMAETPPGKCSPSPLSTAGVAPMLVCPGHDPADGRVCLRADTGFAELQLRAGSGSWGIFPEVLSHTWDFLLLYLFIAVPLEGGGGPQCGKVWEEGR